MTIKGKLAKVNESFFMMEFLINVNSMLLLINTRIG